MRPVAAPRSQHGDRQNGDHRLTEVIDVIALTLETGVCSSHDMLTQTLRVVDVAAFSVRQDRQDAIQLQFLAISL